MNRKQLEHELEHSKQPEAVLPQALNVIACDYYRYASVQLAMNYYNYYEMMTENQADHIDALFVQASDLIRENILSGFDPVIREKSVKKIDELRNHVLSVMQKLTAFADQFAIHEYILNRIEKSFDETEDDMDNDAAINDILGQIFCDKDQMMIQTRIRTMLSQLPIRMTKNRFFDMLKDSLSAYEGSNVSTVEDYLYMLRSAAGLAQENETKISDCDIEELSAYLKQIETLDPNEVTKEEFDHNSAVLAAAVAIIQQSTDRYFTLQEMINPLYVMILTRPYVSTEAENCLKELLPILSGVETAVRNNTCQSIEDEILDHFEVTEGKLEQYVEALQSDEAMLDSMNLSYQELIEALMLKPEFTCLTLARKLCSNSVFIDLGREETSLKADAVYLNQQYAVMTASLEEVLKTRNKMYNRAVIAAVLREMPVMFSNVDEVKDYIKNSLAGCKDYAEKAASVELFLRAVEDN